MKLDVNVVGAGVGEQDVRVTVAGEVGGDGGGVDAEIDAVDGRGRALGMVTEMPAPSAGQLWVTVLPGRPVPTISGTV